MPLLWFSISVGDTCSRRRRLCTFLDTFTPNFELQENTLEEHNLQTDDTCHRFAHELHDTVYLQYAMNPSLFC
jgi:hypothetical protein